jgi:hypothetical protein
MGRVQPTFHGTTPQAFGDDRPRPPRARSCSGSWSRPTSSSRTSPRVMPNVGLDDAVLATRPDLVMLRMPAFGSDGPWRRRLRPDHRQVSGIALTGTPRRAALRSTVDPIAGIHGAIAVLAARAAAAPVRGGTSSCRWWKCAQRRGRADRHLVGLRHAARTGGNRGPRRAAGVYACRGDEQWVAVSIRTGTSGDRCAPCSAIWWALGRARDPRDGAYHDNVDHRLSGCCSAVATVGRCVARRRHARPRCGTRTSRTSSRSLAGSPSGSTIRSQDGVGTRGRASVRRSSILTTAAGPTVGQHTGVLHDELLTARRSPHLSARRDRACTTTQPASAGGDTC